MATSFSHFNKSVHFHYFYQKTTANPTLGHGMIKLPKPLHFTRIGVRALHGSQLDGKYVRLPNGHREYPDETRLLEVLKNALSSSKPPNTAADLSVILEHIRSEDRLGRVYDEKILKPEHIEKIWQIADAGNNYGADPILPRDPLSPEKWIGMAWDNHTKVVKDFLGHLASHRFRLKGNLEMLICRNEVGIPGVIFQDKSKLPSGLLSVEWNTTNHRNGVGPVGYHLAFKFGNGTELLGEFRPDVFQPGSPYHDKMTNEWNEVLKVIADKKPKSLSDPFVVYLRCIGSNVMVGQAWETETDAENHEISCGKLLLVKDPPKK